MICTISSGIFLVLILLVRSKRQKPFITNKILNTLILVLSLILILSGIVWFFVLLFKGSLFSNTDYALSLFLTGIAITGFIAETPKDKPKKR